MLLDIIADIYHSALFSDGEHAGEARVYLHERGFTDTTLNHFRIGYCYGKKGYRELKGIGVTDNHISNSGMFNGEYGTFNGMITIPIIHNNRVVHFTARHVKDRWKELNLNAPHKHLTGHFRWAFNEDEIKRYNYVVITESPFDTMTLWQHGIPAIATFGIGGVSSKVAKRIIDKRIYIAYDREENGSGQKGAVKLANLLCQLGGKPCVIEWPNIANKVDVNSFFQIYDKDSFKYLLKNATYHQYTPKPKRVYNDDDVSMDIERIAKRYFNCMPINRGYLVICPYHKDSKPSMHIYTDTNEFYCYGCGMTGKPLQLLTHLERDRGNTISTKQAIELYSTF